MAGSIDPLERTKLKEKGVTAFSISDVHSIGIKKEIHSIWMTKMSHGCGVFGDLTSDVLSWTGKMKRLKKSKRKEFAFGNK